MRAFKRYVLPRVFHHRMDGADGSRFSSAFVPDQLKLDTYVISRAQPRSLSCVVGSIGYILLLTATDDGQNIVLF